MYLVILKILYIIFSSAKDVIYLINYFFIMRKAYRSDNSLVFGFQCFMSYEYM